MDDAGFPSPFTRRARPSITRTRGPPLSIFALPVLHKARGRTPSSPPLSRRVSTAAAVLLPRAAQRRLRPWQLLLCLGSPDRAADAAAAAELGLRLVHVNAAARCLATPAHRCATTGWLRSCTLTGTAGLASTFHAPVVKLGAQENLFAASALVLCYAGLPNLPDARRLFDGMRQRDAVLWTSMLSAHDDAERAWDDYDVTTEPTLPRRTPWPRSTSSNPMSTTMASPYSLLPVCDQPSS